MRTSMGQERLNGLALLHGSAPVVSAPAPVGLLQSTVSKKQPKSDTILPRKLTSPN